MGADVIGWRSCPLQRSLGRDEFLHKLKLRAYRRTAESLAQPSDPTKCTVRIRTLGRGIRTTTLQEIIDELGDFEQGIPDCHTCPVSAGKVLGCYAYLTYPIDEPAESSVFQYVVEGAAQTDSMARWMVDEVISHLARDPMDLPRGPSPGMVAARTEPIEATVPSRDGELPIDSSMVLDALRLSLDECDNIEAYARFYGGFFAWLDAAGGVASPSLSELRKIGILMERVARNCAFEDSAMWIDG
jgi:hypothetical protein